MEDIRKQVAGLFGENKDDNYISLDILDRIIYSQNHSASNDEEREYISLGILDKTIDSEKRFSGKKNREQKSRSESYIFLAIPGKKPGKEKCEHLSPVLECFAGGFGHIRCFEPAFHENCRFKLNHRKMIEERMQIRKDMKKFG
ncbi:MAG: hypothetical protein HYT72_01680 [Candidatus Aenigmarchaeota archaeon]|nr:hypothetical protein [Candidatus Aenigmarchaeota archaeon]